MSLMEANLDGLVGPTHNYAGLSFGNVASESNANAVSNPRAAALQGLSKMRLLHSLGVPQLVMPPHPRPNSRWLRALGFAGSLSAQIVSASRQAPELLPYAYSASGMWAANAATVTPSCDAMDGRVHFTPANLSSTAHRAMEAEFTASVLKRIFADEGRFAHHAQLPASPLFSDEGAANHMRLYTLPGYGIHIFAYGKETASPMQFTRRFPARQSVHASRAIARLHGLNESCAIFLRQRPEAVDAGVFHNDVIATGNGNFLFYHEHAYTEEGLLHDAIERHAGSGLRLRKITSTELTLEEAVRTYFFNSQIVTLPGMERQTKNMAWIAPAECRENPRAAKLIRELCEEDESPIGEVHFMDLRESMRNGGGPACLRLRVPMTLEEMGAVHSGVVFNDTLGGYIEEWILAHYRDRLTLDDLRDPDFAESAMKALIALESILDLPGLYKDFW